MFPKERDFLAKYVKGKKVILEVGTGQLDSTRVIAKAIEDSDSILYTCDVDYGSYSSAVSMNNPQVIAHRCTSHELIAEMISKENIPDCVFFDGPEDSSVALKDLQSLEGLMPPNSIFMMHDWDLEGRMDGLVSIKSELVRPYIESSKLWKFVDYLTKPDSIGICCYNKNF